MYQGKKAREYDQEIPQPHTAEQPTTPWKRDKELYYNSHMSSRRQ